jgi:RNA polymerase sigma-B factor
MKRTTRGSRPVDKDRTRELFLKLKEDLSAREELVEMHLPLAEYLARRFEGRGEPLDDLIQVASLGLLKAIDRFDLERGVEFSTFATPTITGELKRHFRDKGWSVRVPRRLQEVGMQIARIIPLLSQEIGRSPTISEIAERLGRSEEEVLEGAQAAQAYSVQSLDAPVSQGDDRGVAERLGQEDEAMEFVEAWAGVAHLIEELSPRDRRIIYLRFVKSQTQSQIAEELGISQMHVSRLLSRALLYLRGRAEEEAVE